MRIQVCLRSTVLILALAAPLLAFAQFQAPSPDELKMTSDPKAPGADAVYLYREEITDDTLHFHSYYVRIKVLTEKGKELATVHIPYEHGQFKVTDIQGRTIHSDGTIIPLTVKATDLMEFKAGTFQENAMVFTLPSVEVGSILEYRLEIRYGDTMVVSPTWEIQQPYFVHKAHYMFTPDSGTGGYITNSNGKILDRLMYAATAPSDLSAVVRDARGRYTLDLTDIPPTPDDDWMPPLNTIVRRVEFYYTYAQNGGEFWQTEARRWTKTTEDFMKPGAQVKKAAAGLVAPADTEDQKARKIYAAVMKLDNTDFGRTKSEAERKKEKIKAIRDADDVWKQQSGSSDEIALLYVALARAAGLTAWPMQVVDRNRAFFDNRYLSMGQLDDYIAIVSIGGKEIYLDPGEKMCTFGELHWKHTIAGGIRLSDKGPEFAVTPAGSYKEAVVDRTAGLSIDAQGNVKGQVSYIMTGPEALYWRQKALENDPVEVKKQFNESIRGDMPDGVEADFDHFLGLENYDSNLIGVVKVSGVIGTATGKRFFIPGLFFESRSKHPFVAEDKRTTPVDLHYAMTNEDDVVYNLPPGYSVESAPQTANIGWQGYAIMTIGTKPTANSIEVQRTFARNFALLGSKDYNNLHDFYQKLATADQQQIVLIRTAAAAKGN
jgi:Domain of Unknown Function with PDB structure (DUF3857)/Transglutaminase-like superfamily